MSKAQALSVSIIIPAFNEEDYLGPCLEAIQNQSVAPLEVIVVDNNSTDDSVKIAQSFPGVRVVHEKRQSVLYARTTGFNAAKGDIIGRIDADTRLPKDWVKQVQALLSQPNVTAVTGPAYWYDMPLGQHNHWLERVVKSQLYKYEKNFPFLFGANMAIRRSAWQAIKGELCERKDIHEDTDLAIHLHRSGYKVVYDPNLQVGASARRLDDSPKDFIRYQNMMAQAFRAHGVEPAGSKIARIGYSAGYVMFYPLRKSYNPLTQKRSLKHLVRGRNPARKNPMS